MARATMPRGPFLLALSLLAVAFLLALGGTEEAGRDLRARAEARREIAAALRTGCPTAEAERLLRQARAIDPGCAARACERGFREERSGHWAEAAAGYADCLACDPQALYPHWAHARMLVSGRG